MKEMVPLIAHIAGPEGGNVPVMIAGGALVLVAVALSAAWKGGLSVGRWVLGVGLVLVVLGAVLSPFGSPAPDATVAILRPAPGERVAAGEPVEIEVAVVGAEIATSPTDEQGGHLHLYVDGQLQQMPYSSIAQVELEPGRHTLRVEYVDNRHISFDPEIAEAIEVTAR
ncbi:MAG: hypothetical protein ACRDI0_06590 [Actinomycetota bacterium]